MSEARKNRTAKVYIDGANIFYAQKKLGWSLDWKKVSATLRTEWNVIEFRYYTGVKGNDEGMTSFLRYLDHLGFTVVTKPLKIIKIDTAHPLYQQKKYTEIYKSNFDVEMTTDMLLERGTVDDILLFSGDSDFAYAVKKLRDVGKRIFVYSSRRTLSWELKLGASRYSFLENHEKDWRK